MTADSLTQSRIDHHYGRSHGDFVLGISHHATHSLGKRTSRSPFLASRALSVFAVSFFAATLVAVNGFVGTQSFAQDAPPADTESADKKSAGSKPVEAAQADTGKELEQQQKQLATQYAKLEEIFIRMSELEATTNPTRASLLMQAAQMSKQLATQQRLLQAGDLLAKGQFSRAIPEQEASRENLKKLLELLQSENRSSRLKDERKRLEDVLKDIRRIENIQRATRGRTESGQDREAAANDQRDLEQQLGNSERDLQSEDSKGKSSQEGSSDETKPTDKPSKSDDSKKGNSKKPDSPERSDSPGKESKDSNDKGSESKDAAPKDMDAYKPESGDSKEEGLDPKNKDSKPSDSKNADSKDANSKDGESKPADSKSADSKQSESPDNASDDGSEESSEDSDESKPSAGKPPSREEQARKRVQRARKRMQQAEKKLREDKRKDAIEEQQKAEEELQKAIAELERILTQLREEEIERALVDLETRLKRMYDLEKTIRDQTEKLANLTGEDKDRQLEIQANKLSIEQMKVVMEGQRALLLLQDEGSSQAFPEALEQVNRDAQMVAKRLVAADVSSSTQGIQDEVLGALEEMLESLKQVQKKREDQKQEQQGGAQQGGGNPEDQPLVDKLAELRLIKTLQLRVNRRTDRLANESNSSNDLVGEVGDPQLREQVQELSTRQQKIQDVTREILLEKAKKN
ncbi:MAG: hypothetical protein FJ308_09925 [Planctomycetes bacterium]|nr:hypothetical protein [Planctomycetota bacterium]